MARITLKGNPHQTVGELPAVGGSAPDFQLVDGDLNDVRLGAYQGKNKILTINPSFDTAVCATAARKFNEQAASLVDTVVLDKNDKVVHAELVGEIAEEPDYAAAINSIR